MEILQIPSRWENYGGARTGPIRYLVLHYTAGYNDTARNNGKYFSRVSVGASAHYFVDETTVVQSVPDDKVAWHCGGSCYYHPECRNGNAIGIEMCTKWKDGEYSLAEETVERARSLTRLLMERYAIPPERVIRHFDVTHKCCPAPMVGAGEPLWEEFKEELMRYNKPEELPDWGKRTVEHLMEQQLLQGSDQGLDLSRDMLRLLVILDRAGMFEQRKEQEDGTQTQRSGQ